jgi:hypothetical protein
LAVTFVSDTKPMEMSNFDSRFSAESVSARTDLKTRLPFLFFLFKTEKKNELGDKSSLMRRNIY